MSEIIKKIKALDCKSKEFVSFSVLFIVIVISIVLFFDFSLKTERILLILGIYFALGIVIPVLTKYLFYLWMFISFSLSKIMFTLLFSVFYCILIIPIGVLKKISKGDFLEKGYNKELKSYWKDFDANRINKESLEKLY
ncbi:hypothetical protein C0583_03845 [Candidatus Parcubacteria bacterium]|nr:MAG: hypothetical protein C0583_03845 [Candidatus Parcubacteria bacterium]